MTQTATPVTDTLVRPQWTVPPLVRRRELTTRQFAVLLTGVCAALAVALGVLLPRWPPHEDETLALFVGRSSLPHMLNTVLWHRGGAPLHFALAWLVVHLGGGLMGLRVISAVFAVAGVAALGVLAARLADRTVGVVTALLASGSWVLLFNGVYGRMYSLFLFTSALSYLALLQALDRGGLRRFALWGVSLLAVIASQPYGAIVLASQGVYVLLRRTRLPAAVVTLAAVAGAAYPFWRADIVLKHRFHIAVVPPADTGVVRYVLHYLQNSAGDFTARWTPALGIALGLALAGFVLLVRERPRHALLTGVVLALPGVGLLAARLGRLVSLESRHLIFALPFFLMLVALALVHFARGRRWFAPVVAAGAIAGLLSTEVAWAVTRTPLLFRGEPHARVEARHAASAWIAQTAGPRDVLFGYEPLYLGAWEQNRRFSPTVVPRADPKLAGAALRRASKPLGHGYWVFDASDTTNDIQRGTIALRYPKPRAEFEARVFGPYLVFRSRRPLRTPAAFLHATQRVMELGLGIDIGDAIINLRTAQRAFAWLG